MKRARSSALTYAIAASALLVTLLLGLFAAYSHASEKRKFNEELTARNVLVADQLALSLEVPMWNFDKEQVGKIVETALRDSELSGVALRYNDVAHSTLFKGLGPTGAPLGTPGDDFPEASLVERRNIGRQGQNLGSLALFFNDQALNHKTRQALGVRIVATLSLETSLLLGFWFLLWFRVLKPLKRENEERFRALLENSVEGMLLIGEDGLVQYATPSVLRILGYGPGEIIRREAMGLAHPDDQAKVLRWRDESLNRPGVAIPVEYRTRHKDGSWRVMEGTLVNRLEEPTIRARVLNFRDVTVRKESERQMMRLERLAAIGQTASGLSHEIRNPLAAISTSAQYLKMQLGDRPSLLTDLDSILRQTDRLKDLVNDLLERSHSAELKLSHAGSAELLQNALKTAQIRYGLASERVDLALDLVHAPELSVDVAQIERVLVNLILNAFQAMPSGGAMTLSAKAQDGQAVIEISDNGPGIPEEKLNKIFEPFYTTKETGSGLGLWICRGIVEEHKGSLEATNLRPRGARLTLRLPLDAKP